MKDLSFDSSSNRKPLEILQSHDSSHYRATNFISSCALNFFLSPNLIQNSLQILQRSKATGLLFTSIISYEFNSNFKFLSSPIEVVLKFLIPVFLSWILVNFQCSRVTENDGDVSLVPGYGTVIDIPPARTPVPPIAELRSTITQFRQGTTRNCFSCTRELPIFPRAKGGAPSFVLISFCTLIIDDNGWTEWLPFHRESRSERLPNDVS